MDPLATYREVRRATVALADGLGPEDVGLQSMPDTSPVKWHLAHTSWFFETFVLRPHAPGYRALDDRYVTLFNSYYHGVGNAHPRAARGLLSRPTWADVLAYRAHVDDAIAALADDVRAGVASIIELGLNHEQQHQELVLTDLLHAFSCNPTDPVYRTARPHPAIASAPLRWVNHDGGLGEFGKRNDFAFDNETPRHTVFLAPFAMASRPVSVREWLEFVDDGGYHRPELWMSLGWDAARANGWDAPAYWLHDGDEGWSTFTLAGRSALDLEAPVCHVTWFEADAFARWSGARLPTEAEWEHVAGAAAVTGNFVDSGVLAPRAASPIDGCGQLFGDVWEWTASPYVPYPGYAAPPGALGEYNGKFMCNQYVLRGGSCASPASHLRATYRNYFPPEVRWQFSGVRLARDP